MVVGPFFCGAVPPNSFPTKYLPFTPHIQDNWSSQTLIRHYKEGRGGPNWAVRGGGQVIFHDLGGRDLLSKVYHSIRETFAILYYGTGCLRNAVLQSAGLFLRFPPSRNIFEYHFLCLNKQKKYATKYAIFQSDWNQFDPFYCFANFLPYVYKRIKLQHFDLKLQLKTHMGDFT